MKRRAVATLGVLLLLVGSTFGASSPTQIDVPFDKSTSDVEGNVTYSFNHTGTGTVILHGTGEKYGTPIEKGWHTSSTEDRVTELSFAHDQRGSEVIFRGNTTENLLYEQITVDNFTSLSEYSGDTGSASISNPSNDPYTDVGGDNQALELSTGSSIYRTSSNFTRGDTGQLYWDTTYNGLNAWVYFGLENQDTYYRVEYPTGTLQKIVDGSVVKEDTGSIPNNGAVKINFGEDKIRISDPSTPKDQQTPSVLTDTDLNGTGIGFEVGTVDGSGHSGWFNDFTAESSFTELLKTENPELDMDNDGEPEAEYNGILNDTETVTVPVAGNLTNGTHSVNVSAKNSSNVDWKYSGHNEARVYVESLRAGNTTTTIGQYLSGDETVSEEVSVSPGNTTFGVKTESGSENTRLSQLEVSGGYSAYRGIYVNPDNPINHEIHTRKNVVWSYSQPVTDARPVGENITMWTDGGRANVSLHSLDTDSEDTVVEFTAEMESGTFNLQLHNLEPNSDYILYQDDVAMTTLTTNESGTLAWNKSSDWSAHSYRIEKRLNGSDSPVKNETNTGDGIVSTGCEGQRLPGLGCVPKPVWFWSSRIGSGVGTFLVGVRAYQKYAG